MSVYSSSERRLIVVGPPFTRVPPADRLTSAALLVAVLPIIGLIAVSLLLTGTGPIFVTTPCIDVTGRRCRLWSFRAPRSTRLGRLLRRRGLERLPVLFSVLDGTVTLREALVLEPIG